MAVSQDAFRKILGCFVLGGRTIKPLEESGGKEDQEALKKKIPGDRPKKELLPSVGIFAGCGWYSLQPWVLVGSVEGSGKPCLTGIKQQISVSCFLQLSKFTSGYFVTQKTSYLWVKPSPSFFFN